MKIVTFLRCNEELNANGIIYAMDKSKPTVVRYFRDVKSAGMVEFTDSKKTEGY